MALHRPYPQGHVPTGKRAALYTGTTRIVSRCRKATCVDKSSASRSAQTVNEAHALRYSLNGVDGIQVACAAMRQRKSGCMFASPVSRKVKRTSDEAMSLTSEGAGPLTGIDFDEGVSDIIPPFAPQPREPAARQAHHSVENAAQSLVGSGGRKGEDVSSLSFNRNARRHSLPRISRVQARRDKRWEVIRDGRRRRSP